MRVLSFLNVVRVYGLVPPELLLPVHKLDEKVRNCINLKSLIILKDILTSGLFFKKDELQRYIESFKFSQDIQESSILLIFSSEFFKL